MAREEVINTATAIVATGETQLSSIASRPNHDPTRKPPSSGTDGFFQTAPKLINQFVEDLAYKRVFEFYLPPALQHILTPELSRFGSFVLDRHVLVHLADAERNPPYLKTWDSFGHRVDELITSEGWRALSAIGIAEGMVAIPYENKYGTHSRAYQFLKYHLWAGSNAVVTCPSAMTDGAAKLLAKQLQSSTLSETERRIFGNAYGRLVSRDPTVAWTSGQWMTERPGGSDVRNTETQATRARNLNDEESFQDIDGQPLGPWSISGFKWFSSATDSQMSILLAKMPDDSISAFYAPMRRWTPQDTSSPSSPQAKTELNGIQIQRLKSKLGTRAVPTAELVLSDLRAYLLGSPGGGIKEISTILNITRVHNVVSAVGSWGRGLAISRAFSRVRSVGGTLLIDHPPHVRTLAHQHVEYRAMMHLSFFVVALLGISENLLTSSSGPAPSALPEHFGLTVDTAAPGHLLRLFTPLAKAITARAAIAGLAECMESLGGVGYLENDDPDLNIARLYRDANVLSIWEGTTNVMADDVVRVLKGREGTKALEIFGQWVSAVSVKFSSTQRGPRVVTILRKASDNFAKHIRSASAEGLRLNGRALLARLGWLVCATLLAADVARDENAVGLEVLRRWIDKKEAGVFGFDPIEGSKDREEDVSAASVEWDRRIVFGDMQASPAEKSRI